jgi:signal transduction histidine kinase
MRLNRLYTKFLFSFLAVLVITEVLVLALFVMIPARHFGVQLDNFAKNKTKIVKGIIEEKIGLTPAKSWPRNVELKQFVIDFSKILNAKIWLTDDMEHVALKSFSENIPDLTKQTQEGFTEHRRFGVFWQNHFNFYHIIAPIEVSHMRVGDVHVLFEKHPFPPARGYFLTGFLVLGLSVALLIIPVSKLMTTRIKKLTQSAIRITDGDLSHRAGISSNDEIGELSRAFNSMTDKLENMIRSGHEINANISHELRSPLTRIRLAEEMLREKLAKVNGGALEDHLDTIREEIQELDRLIGRILELSKLNVREFPLRFEPMDPSELIKDLLNKLVPLIEKKGLSFEAETSYAPPFTGDKDALRSVFANIIENAVKFTPEAGAISITMDWQPQSLDVQVTNTFEKLSEEDLVRIFDPFHRITRNGEVGYGLGLTIARKIVEKHGGVVKAQNGQKGLEMIISLPRTHGA